MNAVLGLNLNQANCWGRFEALLLPLVDISDEIKGPMPILTNSLASILKFDIPYIAVLKTVIDVLSRCSKIYKVN